MLYRGLRATSRSSALVTVMSSRRGPTYYVTGRGGANVALGQSRPCLGSSTRGRGDGFCPPLPTGVRKGLSARPAATRDPLEVTFTCPSRGLPLGRVCKYFAAFLPDLPCFHQDPTAELTKGVTGPPPASSGSLRVASSLCFPLPLCSVVLIHSLGGGSGVSLGFCLAVLTVAALTPQVQEPRGPVMHLGTG